MLSRVNLKMQNGSLAYSMIADDMSIKPDCQSKVSNTLFVSNTCNCNKFDTVVLTIDE